MSLFCEWLIGGATGMWMWSFFFCFLSRCSHIIPTLCTLVRWLGRGFAQPGAGIVRAQKPETAGPGRRRTRRRTETDTETDTEDGRTGGSHRMVCIGRVA
ncbi:hypothetical protein BZA05DRAFT_85781 [Tricharina praecox]|uniref:uncharacterized protein n=1 Tax=Tricharina praecox TaxID=43433 RepID=UPI0022202D78|nr:uncharacterized protein BZA05DRAFT_85781 [Tricharina praecox]KAI5849204.1 hypothetical protein BZA05DRAFT_85781 [Tricharina praecox]